MALFAWDDTYGLNIPHIDEQHRRLMSFINELHEAMLKNEEDTITGKILNDLTNYIKEHFDAEEDLMRKSDFVCLDTAGRQYYEKHTLEHAEFTKKITDMNRQHHEKKSYISVDLLTYLVEWLLNHIANVDKQYASFMKDTRIFQGGSNI